MDHIDGRLFVDYLSGLKRERIRKKLEKERKERAGRSSPTRERRPAL
jgi:peptide deformylase